MRSIKNRLLWQYVGNLYSEANAKWSATMEEMFSLNTYFLWSENIFSVST